MFNSMIKRSAANRSEQPKYSKGINNKINKNKITNNHSQKKKKKKHFISRLNG